MGILLLLLRLCLCLCLCLCLFVRLCLHLFFRLCLFLCLFVRLCLCLIAWKWEYDFHSYICLFISWNNLCFHTSQVFYKQMRVVLGEVMENNGYEVYLLPFKIAGIARRASVQTRIVVMIWDFLFAFSKVKSSMAYETCCGCCVLLFFFLTYHHCIVFLQIVVNFECIF